MTGPFERIVVAYDGSAQARMALERAIDMAKSWSSRLTIVTVYPPPATWTAGPMMGPMVSPEPPREGERRAVDGVLHEAVQTAQDRGISNVRGMILEDHPADAILHVVELERADLVVMGSRGQSTTSRLLLGSVSDAVIHHAQAAVLVVRPRPTG
jgi:nucleotide-binding universal stress UspA family protein